MSEVEVGSTTSGVLDPQTSRRLTVRTKLVGIKTTPPPKTMAEAKARLTDTYAGVK